MSGGWVAQPFGFSFMPVCHGGTQEMQHRSCSSLPESAAKGSSTDFVALICRFLSFGLHFVSVCLLRVFFCHLFGVFLLLCCFL